MTTMRTRFLTFSAIGNREDLVDEILTTLGRSTRRSRPNIGKVKARAVLHEWQPERARRRCRPTRQLEGDDIQSSPRDPDQPRQQPCQISYMNVVVSGDAGRRLQGRRKKEMVLSADEAVEGAAPRHRVRADQQPGGRSPQLETARQPATALRLVRDKCRARCRPAPTARPRGGDRRNAARPHRIAGQSQIQAAWTQGASPTSSWPGRSQDGDLRAFTGNNRARRTRRTRS